MDVKLHEDAFIGSRVYIRADMAKLTGTFLQLLRTRNKIQQNKSARKLLYEFD
jgi:hypothetical protein